MNEERDRPEFGNHLEDRPTILIADLQDVVEREEGASIEL